MARDVVKVGGMVSATAKSIDQCCRRILALNNPVVIVSATGKADSNEKKTTDLLAELFFATHNEVHEKTSIGEAGKIYPYLLEKHEQIADKLGIGFDDIYELFNELANDILGLLSISSSECVSRQLELIDRFMSYGERFSARIYAAHLRNLGANAVAVDAWDAGMVTDANFGDARPLPNIRQKLAASVSDPSVIYVVTGFIGKTADGRITTLGRGASDTTAAWYAAAINEGSRNKGVLYNFTDVDGIFRLDPSAAVQLNVRNQLIPKMSYEEALEHTTQGAKLHPRSIEPVRDAGIHIRVLNPVNDPNDLLVGTLISESSDTSIKGITCRQVYVIEVHSADMVDHPGYTSAVAAAFGRHNIDINLVYDNRTQMAFSVDKLDGKQDEEDALGRITDQIRSNTKARDVRCPNNLAQICVVGNGIRNPVNIATINRALWKAGVTSVEHSAHKGVSYGFIVPENLADAVTKALYGELFS